MTPMNPLGNMGNPQQYEDMAKAQLAALKKIRENAQKQNIANTYMQVVIMLTSRYEAGESIDGEKICRKAMDIAKWASMIWLEEYPDSDEDLMNQIQFRIPAGGF